MTGPRVGARSLVRAVPVWAWLAALVAVSSGIRILLARGMVAPWIMVDEIVYSELAKSFAATGHFSIRGASAGTSYGFVYPVLISPAYRLASLPDAYAAAKAINSVLMSLAAIPAYLLARRVLNQWLALAAAVLSVAIPSLVYTGTLMTENAFYPLFLCIALVLVLMLERPTTWNQLLVLALCALAYATRQQALTAFAGVLTAPLLLGRRRLGRFRTLYLSAAALAVAALVVEGARGKSPISFLGAHQTAGHHHYAVVPVAKWLLWHVAELDLYLGVVPVIAFVLLVFEWRKLDARQRAFMAGASALTAWLIVYAAGKATYPGIARVEERNTFYVAPFFFIALLLWVQLGARRPHATTVAVALAAGLLVATLPYPRLLGPQTTSDTLGLVPWWKLHEQHDLGLHNVWLVATLCALGAAALFVLVPQRWALALPLLVLVYFAYVAQPVQNRTTLASRNARAAGIGAVPDDWLDRAVGRDANIALLWAGRTDQHVVWENAFFNRSVGPIYYLEQPFPGGFASAPFSSPAVSERLLLSDGSLDFRGVKRASDSQIGVNLWQVSGTPQAVTNVTGLYPGSNWSGRVVVYQRQACTGGSLHVDVLSDPVLFPRPRTVTANGFGRVVFPGARAGISVPLRHCTARFVVSPTRPAGPGQQPLGIRFLTFAYSR